MKAIIGLGNPLKSDDGVGILLINEIQKKDIPSDVEVFDAGTGGMKILHLLNDVEKALIVDAIHFGGKPGDSVFFKPEEVESLNKSQSSHDANFLEVLELSKTLEEAPKEIIIMGIEPKDTSFGEEVSSEIENKIPNLTNDLFEKAMEIFDSKEGR